MTEDSREIVITLDFRKLFALSLLTIITLVTLYTYIIALLAWDAPTVDLATRVVDLGSNTKTLDNYGALKTTFNQGDLFDLSVRVEAADRYWLPPSYYYDMVADFSFRLIVTIFDPNGVPMLCTSYTDTISPAGFGLYNLEADMLGSFYQIPSDAVSASNYKVRIVLWSDWLPGGIARAVQAWELTFEVGV